jgi:hypothetical protein
MMSHQGDQSSVSNEALQSDSGIIFTELAERRERGGDMTVTVCNLPEIMK